MAGQDKTREQVGWPDWDDYPDFTDLTYRPLYIDDIAGTLNRAASGLEDLLDARRLDVDQLSRRVKHILGRLLVALEDYCRARSLAEYCFQVNRSDAYFAAERDRYRSERRRLNDLMRDIYQAILRHDELLVELADETGKMPLFHVQNQTAINRYTVNPEQEEENRLVARLQANGEMVKDIPLALYRAGADRPAPEAVSNRDPVLQEDASRWADVAAAATRQPAATAAVNPLLDRLLAVRKNLAEEQGFPNFISLGYRRLGYFGIEPEAALKLHNLIVDYVVPLAADLRYLKGRGGRWGAPQDVLQASVLPFKHWWEHRGLSGSTALKLHPYLDGAKRKKAGRLKETPAADRLFNEVLVSSLGGYAPDFWLQLRDKGYIQIYNRPGQDLRDKCYRLFDPPFPALYCNLPLLPETLAGYFNMAGRAYGYLCCSDDYNPFTYLDPGLANVRIWGKGMEFLCYFGADLLFASAEDADRWRFCHMANTVLEMPLLALLDAFQFRLYTAGETEPADRNQIWLEEVRRFFPDLADDSAWLQGQAGRWTGFRSTYTEPFSPLSKLMASLTGVSLWRRSLDRRSTAILAFENFCTMTNDDMLPEILNKSRLPNPFSKDSLKKSMYKVSAFLDEGTSIR